MLRLFIVVLMLSLSGCTLFKRPAPQKQDYAPAKAAEEKPRNEALACDKLRVEADWQGNEAPEAKKVCSYSAPSNCQIRHAPTVVHSENGGYHTTLVSEDGKSMTTTVTARARGVGDKRTKGWIEVSVFAQMDCR
jgi:hypothetical protein